MGESKPPACERFRPCGSKLPIYPRRREVITPNTTKILVCEVARFRCWVVGATPQKDEIKAASEAAHRSVMKDTVKGTKGPYASQSLDLLFCLTV
ncbi:hypothetical protein TB2_035941 [Malus domestica]